MKGDPYPSQVGCYASLDEMLVTARSEQFKSEDNLFTNLQTLQSYLQQNNQFQSIPAADMQYHPLNKWVGLTVDAVFMHGTFAGFSSALLYEFVHRGIRLPLVGSIFLVLLLPIILTMPHVIYKLGGDTSSAERLLYMEWLVFQAKECLIKEYFIEADSFVPRQKKRAFFNRSLRETFYLSGTVFYLGCTLVAFWLTTPLGWGIVGVVTLIIGLSYLFYHNHSIQKSSVTHRNVFFANQSIKQKENAFLGLSELNGLVKYYVLIDDENKTDLELYNQLIKNMRDNNNAALVDKCIANFPMSSKWLNIILHTFFIEGTFSVFTSVLLLSFLKYGLLVGMLGLVSMTLALPMLAALPYLIFKIATDMSKEERLARIELLVLTSEIEQLKAIATRENKSCARLETVAPVPPYFFSNTAFETFFLIGSVFSLGFSVLVAFSLCTPVGWVVIALAATLVGLVYAYYHDQYMRGFDDLKRKIADDKSHIFALKKSLLLSKAPPEPSSQNESCLTSEI